MSLGETIFNNRKKMGISQEELADLLSVTRQSISLWETNQTVPSASNMVRLSEIFKISIDELYGNPHQQAKTDLIAEISAEFDKPLIKSIMRISLSRIWAIDFFLIAISVLMLIFIPFTDAQTEFIILPLIIFLIALVSFITATVRCSKYCSTALNKHHKTTIRFYSHGLEIEHISDSSNSKYSKSYSQIKKLSTTRTIYSYLLTI